MPTTHTWKPNANGFIYEAANYVDGVPFTAGDTLVLRDGSTNAAGVIGGFEYLYSGRYQFEINGLQAGLALQNIGLDKATTLSAKGPGLLQWTGLQQFINDGRIEVGSAAAQGNLSYTLTNTFRLGETDTTFTNTGAIALQNSSAFRLIHSAIKLGGSFLNAAGGYISATSGSLFEQVLPSSSGLPDTATSSEGKFRNDGTIVLNGTAGRGAGLSLQTDIIGNGSYSVRGAPGDNPALTYAQFGRSTNAAIYVSSGTLRFDGVRGITDANAVSIETGSITFLDGNAVLDIDIGAGAFSVPYGNNTQLPFGAVLRGFQAGNTIKLKIPRQTGSPQVTYDQPTNTLKLVSNAGTVLAQFNVVGSYQSGDFQVAVTPGSIDATAVITTTKPAQFARFSYVDTPTGAVGSSGGEAVDQVGNSYLQWQYIDPGQGGRSISAQAPNVFLKGGAGNDALAVTGSMNVLDGGTGSNFLVGTTGADGGTDTFFTDARTDAAVWNTLANFGRGDQATLWGFTAGVSRYRWDGISGAKGYEGATLRADIRGTGREDASITFAGLTVEQASKLTITTGGSGADTYLYFQNPGV